MIVGLLFIPKSSYAENASGNAANALVINYSLSGGTITGERKYKTEEFAELTKDYTLPKAVKSDYVFNGWEDEDGNPVATISAGTKGTINLYATWEQKNSNEGDVTAKLDIPTAVTGQIYKINPFKFANNGNRYEVIYHSMDIGSPYEYVDRNDATHVIVTEKDGLFFRPDGTIRGRATCGEKWLDLIAGIVIRDNNNQIIGYREYELWLHIQPNPTRYDIPSDVSEIDLSVANSTDWVEYTNGDYDHYIPSYMFTVSQGNKKWVKIKASTSSLTIIRSWKIGGSVDIIGEDGLKRLSYYGDVGDYTYRVNPGDTYYVYVDNSNGSKDCPVYISDGCRSKIFSGNLGSWSFKKTKSNVNNPLDDSSSKWIVYTVGELNNLHHWKTKGLDPYGWYIYYCSLNVISKVPVFYINPRFDSNFASSYSIYKQDDLSSQEEEMLMDVGESHNKINYAVSIADSTSSMNRQSRFTVDIYIPAGYSLYRGDDDYLHVKEGDSDEPEQPCNHNFIHYSQKDPTGRTNGNTEYWVCENCMRYFSDASGTNEIHLSDTVIPAADDLYTVEHVTEMMNALTSDSDERFVTAIREAYDDLSAEQKTQIPASALQKLTDAEKAAQEGKTSEETNKDIGSTEQVKPKSILVKKINLSGISKQIALGKKVKLKATVLPENATNKKLKWITSNKKLATVTQSGLVKIAKKAKPGKTVKITAVATDGSNKKAIWKIKIMKGAVKSIKIKGIKKTLQVGKTMKLKAVVKTTKGKPVNKKVKWTSGNTKYATVSSSGKVKALRTGKGKKVKITAMATDGTGKKKTVSFKIK